MMKPYYQDDQTTLYHGDWRTHLEMLAGLGAALIVTDPPYGETSLEWDHWPDGWPALAATLAPAMWCFGSMRMFLDRRDEFAGWKLSQDLVWEKHNGSNLAADRFSRVHEHVLHWYQSAWSDIHHETPTSPDAARRTVRKKARPAQWIGATGPAMFTSEDGGPRLMRSVLYARSMHGQNPINETQKPTSILEHLIAYGCPPGGTVIDLFAGSASTLEAAKLTGRRAVGFEVRESQCEQAAHRLAQGVLEFGQPT